MRMRGTDKFIRLFFPLRCPVCDRPVAGLKRDSCPGCEERFIPVMRPRCAQCSKPLPEDEEGLCADCAQTKHAYDKGVALYSYRSVADSLYRFKYMGRQEYAHFYASRFCARYGAAIRALSPDAIVPVPAHKKREQKRGYNQAALFAREIGRRLRIPVREDLVRRTLPTAPQKELGVTERRNNLKNAFLLARNDVKLKTIIVVDDIYTTGATIDAVAHIFRQCGVRRIYFATIAIGGSQEPEQGNRKEQGNERKKLRTLRQDV